MTEQRVAIYLNFRAYLTPARPVATYYGHTKKRTKRTNDHVEILRGGLRTTLRATALEPAVFAFPAHLCTRP